MDVSGVDLKSQGHVHGDFHHHTSQTRAHHTQIERGDEDSDGDSGGRSESHFSPSASARGVDHDKNTGTYQVTQIQFFSAAALFLLGQTGASSPSQSSSALADPGTQTASVTRSSANAPAQAGAVDTQIVSPAVPQTVPQTTAPATAGTSSLNTASPTTPVTQDPLQAFNTALKSLGLNDQQISAFDQVANLINTVSPAIFSDLVGQLQGLVQQASQASQSVTASPASTGATPPASAQSNGGYQITELSIKFAGVELQGTTGTANASSESAGRALKLSQFNLSIEEVKITLADGNGQSSQIASSQPAATKNSPTLQTPASSGPTA